MLVLQWASAAVVWAACGTWTALQVLPAPVAFGASMKTRWPPVAQTAAWVVVLLPVAVLVAVQLWARAADEAVAPAPVALAALAAAHFG